MNNLASLPRELERQVEIWALIRPFESPDVEDLAYNQLLHMRARKVTEYREMRLFDPWSYRELRRRQEERRALEPRCFRKLKNSDKREMVRMYQAGASARSIARAFKASEATVHKHVRAALEEKRQPGHRRNVTRGEAHPRFRLTNEFLKQVALASGSNRAIGRLLGVHHTTVNAAKEALARTATPASRGERT